MVKLERQESSKPIYTWRLQWLLGLFFWLLSCWLCHLHRTPLSSSWNREIIGWANQVDVRLGFHFHCVPRVCYFWLDCSVSWGFHNLGSTIIDNWCCNSSLDSSLILIAGFLRSDKFVYKWSSWRLLFENLNVLVHLIDDCILFSHFGCAHLPLLFEILVHDLCVVATIAFVKFFSNVASYLSIRPITFLKLLSDSP